MSLFRRQQLDVASRGGTNAGLWLDKYLESNTDPDKSKCIDGAITAGVPAEYGHAFNRWRSSFDCERARAFHATTVGRLIVGLGSKGTVDAGIHLDRTWGVPLLPGSALKGLASRKAHQDLAGHGWRRPTDAGGLDGGELHEFLFGTTRRSGAVLFHDAWWEADQVQPLQRDVMTVHHPDYYQKPDHPVPPSDFDNPTPIPFVSTSGRFRIVLERASGAVAPGWLDISREILMKALQEDGLGAKTNAGYGRFAVGDWLPSDR